jgi:hypothetical protein
MTTYTLTNGTAVFRNPNENDNVTSVDQTNITLEIVVPDSTTTLRYKVDPLLPGDGPGDETVESTSMTTMSDYNVRLNHYRLAPVGSAMCCSKF